MTNKTLARLQKLFELLLISVTYFAMMVAVYCGILGKPESIMWHSIVILIPAYVTFLLRRKVKKYSVFMLGHIVLMIAGPMLGTNDYDCTFYFLSVAVVCIHSIRLKTQFAKKGIYYNNPAMQVDLDSIEKEEEIISLSASERMSPYYAIIMVAGYILAGNKGNILVQNVQVALFVIFVLLQVVYNQIQKMNLVFYTNRDKSEFPAKQMFRINIVVAFVLMGCIAIGMMAFYYGKYGNLFTIAGSLIFAVVRLLIKILLTIMGLGPETDNFLGEEETTTETDTSTEESETMESIKGSKFMEALAETIGFILLFAVIIGVVYIIVKYARSITKSKREGFDEVEFIKDGKNIDYIRDDSAKERDVKKYNHNIALRKLYKKKVILGNGRKKPDTTLTPVELTKNNITTEENTAEKVTEAYERARYSNESVSKEDIEFLKKLP